MFEIFSKSKALCLYCIVLVIAACTNAQELDKTRYITLDEIKPGMPAYCLTCYKGTKIEKFGLEVLSIIRNVMPGRDAILVQGTDPRFIHTGPVHGCSGSPVYIDGRLAGALAFGWRYSKDPLYGVTPIAEMLEVEKSTLSNQQAKAAGFTFDYSTPLDFAEIQNQMTTALQSLSTQPTAVLPCPLIISGISTENCSDLTDSVKSFGLIPVSGIGGKAQNDTVDDVRLAPGATLAVPLVTGDIEMDVIATVTEVDGDKVYGFGHSYLGYGSVDLPMATGQIHTVVSSRLASFKFGTALNIVGAIKTDQAAAVYGQVGAEARMIPLTITIDRYNVPQAKKYDCKIVNNRLITPLMLGVAVTGAALSAGSLPPDNMIEYDVSINLQDADSVSFKNISTDFGTNEMIREVIGAVALIMNNPYKDVNIESLDFDIRIVPESVSAHIWSVDLSDSKVKPGDKIDVDVVTESVFSEKNKYTFGFEIPEQLRPGKYELSVLGPENYRRFLRKNTPYKFIPQSFDTLVDAINNILAVRRDKLYCVLNLPAAGLTLEKAELPDLPPTKALLLSDTKRTLKSRPFSHWIERTVKTNTVIIDKRSVRITVEK